MPEPEDINWNSYEVGILGKIFRVLIAALIIIVLLALSCTIIGLCSIYISSHSVSCEGVTIPPDVATAKTTLTTDKEIKCFCQANLFASFQDSQLVSYCGTKLT